MKNLSIYTIILSLLITLIYTVKVHWVIETDGEFYRATALTLLSEFGLWCTYYYARDYEAIREHDEAKERMRRFIEENSK